jgi:branched-subunit amino acid transport protein AzlD
MILTNIFIIIAATIATIITRISPMWISKDIKSKQWFKYLSDVLPVTSFGLLVVYALKGVSITVYPYGISELVSIIVIVGIVYWKENILLGIFSGTVLYMIIINVIM